MTAYSCFCSQLFLFNTFILSQTLYTFLIDGICEKRRKHIMWICIWFFVIYNWNLIYYSLSWKWWTFTNFIQKISYIISSLSLRFGGCFCADSFFHLRCLSLSISWHICVFQLLLSLHLSLCYLNVDVINTQSQWAFWVFPLWMLLCD